MGWLVIRTCEAMVGILMPLRDGDTIAYFVTLIFLVAAPQVVVP